MSADEPEAGGAERDAERLGATARGSLVNGVGAAVSAVLNVLLVLLVTRSYGAAAAGVLFGVVALISIVGTVCKLGTETAQVYTVSRARADGRPDLVGHLIRRGLIIPIAVAMAAAVALVAGAETVAGWFTDADRQESYADAVRFTAPFIPFWVASLGLLGSTRGFSTMKPTAISLQMVQPTLQLVLVAIGVALDWSVARLALLWAVPMVVTTGLAAGWVHRLMQAEGVRGGLTDPDERRQVDRAYWAFAIPRGVAGSIQQALDRVGILLVGGLAGASAAGVWATIARLVNLAQRAFHAIGQSLNPRLSVLLARGDERAAAGLLHRISALTSALLVPPLVVVVVFAPTVLRLFGGDQADEFEVGVTALVIASIAGLVATVFAHVDNVILMSGWSALALANTTAALAVLLALNFALVPEYELEGAAIALAGSIVLYRLLPLGQVRHRLGFWAVDAESGRVVASALVIVGGVCALARAVIGEQLVVAVIAGVVGFVLHLAVVTRWALHPDTRRLLGR